jgi:hypothetical protein
MAKDLMQELAGAVETAHKAKATFKNKVRVKEKTKDGKTWEGDVYVFHLLYTTRRTSAPPPNGDSWQLPKPSPKDLNAAEARGKKMKQDFQQTSLQPEKLRKAKLAYAWAGKAPGSRKPKLHTALHEGEVNSAETAVKLAKDAG